jgi:hypothetical protein
MKLEEQKYYVQYHWEVHSIWHSELLWDSSQIIRLQKNIFAQVNDILATNNSLSLFNLYNPINEDIIQAFQKNSLNFDGAILWEIIWKIFSEPIINGNTLTQVKVIEMRNISILDLYKMSLKDTLAHFWVSVSPEELIYWLSHIFYSNSVSSEKIKNDGYLFWRRIKKTALKNFSMQ